MVDLYCCNQKPTLRCKTTFLQLKNNLKKKKNILKEIQTSFTSKTEAWTAYFKESSNMISKDVSFPKRVKVKKKKKTTNHGQKEISMIQVFQFGKKLQIS